MRIQSRFKDYYDFISHRFGSVPVLKDLGFPSSFPPEVIWQDIYSTLTNVLRVNPDKAPPIQVGEKFRIEAAGFDLKTSFRHPVNPKKKKVARKVK